MIYTHQVWSCTETVKILHTELNSNKKATKITDINPFTAYAVSLLAKIVAIYAFLLCKIFGREIRPCSFFFDKSQVC